MEGVSELWETGENEMVSMGENISSWQNFFEYGDEYSETKYGNPSVLISEGEKMGS